jgi:predicted ATPase
MWLALARLIRGRIRVEQGDPQGGLQEMQAAHALWQSTGTILTTSFFLAMRADGLALAGRPEAGLPLLEGALDVIERVGERYYEAEVLRLHACLRRQLAEGTGADCAPDVESWLRRALEAAQRGRQRSLALRAATSLADLWLAQGRHAEARQVLRAASQAIEEGHATRDVQAARALLARLA